MSITASDIGARLPVGATAANLVSGYGQVGGTDPRQVLTLWQPLVIDSAMNFNVTVAWPAGAVTVLLLFIGIHNAWDTVTYVAVEDSQPENKSQD